MKKLIEDCFDCRRGERVFTAAMSVCFFLVISTFWILKPIKKTVFIAQFDESGVLLLTWHLSASQAELIAKILNMVVAFGAVVLFTWFARRFRRQTLIHIFSVFFILCFAAFSLIMTRPSDLATWSFYLLGDLFSTLMVATFFAFLNDSVTPDSAKRLYGLIGLGGVLGGAVGSTALRAWIDSLTISEWMWVTLGIAVVIVAVAFAAGRLVDRDPPERRTALAATGAVRSANPALEGAKLVVRSPYLLSIVAIVGLYEIVSTVLDFQFTETVSHYLDGDAIGRRFSTMYAVTNWTSLLVQLFLTSFVMTRFGLTTALLVLPVAMLAGSAAFLVLPVLWVGSFLNTIDNGFSYSINQSAKEALYVPATRDEKYKAKAFIDMFVQRFAKALAVGVNLTVAAAFAEFSGIRWLGVFTMAIIVVWIAAARYAGGRFRALSEGS